MAKSRPPTGKRETSLPVISAYRQHDKIPQFQAIMQAHDEGYFHHSAPLWDEIRTDDRIQGVVATRVGAILSAPLSFQPAGPRRKQIKIAELIGGAKDKRGTWEEMFSTPAVAEILSWGIGIGVGFGQLIWDKPSPTEWKPRLVPWHPQYLRWDWMKRRFVVQTAGAGAEVVLPRPDEQPRGDGQWIVYCPYGVEYGWRSGLIRSLCWKYLSRQWTERDWDRHNERQGLGILKAVSPSNSQPAQREAFYEGLNNIGSEAVVHCTTGADGKPGFDVQVEEFTARTWEGMKFRREGLDTDIAIAVLGQNLTTELKEGSLAGIKMQNLVRIDRALQDAKIGPVLQAQGLSWFCQHNHGDPALAPRPVFEVEPPDDELGEAQALKTLGEALNQLVVASERVDVPGILEAHGIPMITEEELAARKALEAEEAAANDEEEPPPDDGGDGGGDEEGEDKEEEGQTAASLVAATVKHERDGWHVYSEGGRHMGGPYANRERAEERLRQIEHYKAQSGAGGDAVKRRYDFQGLPIAVEHPAGTIRMWSGPEGDGHTKMLCDYGFIEGYLSGDDEEIDCYVGGFDSATEVYIIHQLMAPDCKRWDEDKVMLGFPSGSEAKQVYLAHRNDGDRCFGGMLTLTLEQFKQRLRRRRPETTRKIRASALRAETVRALLQLAGRVGERSTALKRTVAGKQRAARYEESLIEKSMQLAARALAPHLTGMLAELRKADDLQDARRRLLAYHSRTRAPTDLRETLRKMAVLSDLAGQDAANKLIRRGAR